MRKTLTFLLLLFVVCHVSAQSYEQLWQQADKASDQDLPQTALKVVRQIRQKALTEGNDAQFLRASLMCGVYHEEIAPDSAKLWWRQMEEALRREQRPVEQALWHAALAQAYQPANRPWQQADTAYVRLATAHFKASVAQPHVLSQARYRDYLPLFKAGADSKYYNDDLLHVLWQAYAASPSVKQTDKAALRRSLIALYSSQGNRSAALLLTLDSLSADGRGAVKGRLADEAAWQALQRVAGEYADLPLNVETYICLTQFDSFEGSLWRATNDSLLVATARVGLARYGKEARAGELRNFVAGMENPTAYLEGVPAEMYPGQTYKLKLRVRNMAEVSLFTSYYGASQLDFSNAGDKAKPRKQTRTVYRMQQMPATAWQTREVEFTAPAQPGVYALSLGKKGDEDRVVVNVTTLRGLSFAWPKGENRVVVVDTRTGHPVPGATLTAYTYKYNSGYRQVRAYTADAQGVVQVNVDKLDKRLYYQPSMQQDQAAQFFTLSDLGYYGSGAEKANTTLQLFTDRAIYRPGQQVRFSGVAYTRQGDNFKAEDGLTAMVKLYNVNGKAVDSLSVRTDAFGSFSGTFTLPAATLPGTFRLVGSNGSVTGRQYVQVEEYKRPTFTAETEPLKVAYALGDTVQVAGKAQTYSGVPVGGARVQWTVRRTMWYRLAEAGDDAPQTGETVTDEAGRFTLPVVLQGGEADGWYRGLNRFFFNVSYTVTAENGETAQGTTTLTTANRAAWLETSVPERLCREQLPDFRVRQVNAAGQDMAAEGRYVLRSAGREVAAGTFRTAEAFRIAALQTLPSGDYELEFSTVPSVANDTVRFVLFSERDVRPASRADKFFTYTRRSAQADSAFVMVGTPERDVVLYYDLVAADRLIESRRYVLTDSVLHFRLAYQPSYGESARAFFAFVRDGKLYHYDVTIEKPRPDKRLVLNWTTFRSRLVPGQAEEWRLRVTRPDGTPADASLMARLYDASLDVFAKNPWDFTNLSLYRQQPNAAWSWTDYAEGYRLGSVSVSGNYKHISVSPLNFTAWDGSLFSYNARMPLYETVFIRGSRPRKFLARNTSVMYKSESGLAMPQAMTDDAAARDERQLADANAELGAPLAGGVNATDAVKARTNFSETAYFQPALRTDSLGEVAIAFTLPESMTQWNFTALAYTRGMDYGRLDTCVVARKDFMVEPALPRFVRRGDRAVLPVTVRNLAGNAVEATLRLRLTDALTGREVHTADSRVALQPGESRVYTFTYDVQTDAAVLVCRTVAAGQGFSDGEERYLPVLSDLVEVTRSLPFSLTEAGTRTLRIDTLWNARQATHRSLTVELSSNPTWYAVSALPVLAGSGDSRSATEWATRYYALALGAHIGALNPEIRQLVAQSPEAVDALSRLKLEGFTDNTPWLRNAETEQQRAAALRTLFDADEAAARIYTAVDKLKALQRPDGSWSWYSGMPGNDYITADVAIMLARVQKLTDEQAASPLLQSAVSYLQAAIAKQVRDMKQREKRDKTELQPDEMQLRYLYLRALLGMKPDADAAYLLDRAAHLSKQLSMYGKAITAVVLAEAGYTDKARTNLQSLMEHTVQQPEMGRYFDTDRAQWSWNAYRIPTQVAAIEALRYFARPDSADQMRLWLMQSKRTQVWETSRATADAVYALLLPQAQGSRVMSLSETSRPVQYTLYKGRRVVAQSDYTQPGAPATVGYIKNSYADTDVYPQPVCGAYAPQAGVVDATRLELRKPTDGLSWGSVYATFTVPAAEVQTAGKGLTLQRRFEVKRGAQWVALASGEVLHRGDRVRQVFTLTADRDYDFVSLNASRPACLEPARPLSGYQWAEGLSAYRVVRDACTEYYIEQVRKGTHTFTEELFADRAGAYATGIATVQCVYAPEFRATAAATTLTAE